MVDIFLQNPLWQSLWIIAMLILFYWLTNKDDNRTLQIIMVSLVFWGTHFIAMEVYSWVVWSTIWILRTFLSMKYKYNKRIFTWLIIITLIAWFFTYKDTYSLLPIIWSCISVYWYFFFDRIKLRLFMIVTSFFWFSFSFWNALIWWMVNEVVVQIILLSTMYKMIQEEWKSIYIIDKVLSKFKKPKIDVWRFISLYDFKILRKFYYKKK